MEDWERYLGEEGKAAKGTRRLSLEVSGAQPNPGASERCGDILRIVPLGGEEPGVFIHQLPSSAFGGHPRGITCSTPSGTEEASQQGEASTRSLSAGTGTALCTAEHLQGEPRRREQSGHYLPTDRSSFSPFCRWG